MKNLYTIAFILLPVLLSAQAPQKVNYQTIVRNAQGTPVANRNVSFLFTIIT